MNRQVISVRTGSRLHFGLTRFRAEHPAQFRGAGVMIEAPVTRLRVLPARSFFTNDQRSSEFARRWSRESGSALPACELLVDSKPDEHSGFGSGTQMAHAVASALNGFTGLAAAGTGSASDANRIARQMDRGQRSMIGSYGFVEGGMLIDGTDQSGQPQLRARLALPESWRLVLVLPKDARKKFGLQEQAAFDNILAEQETRSQRLESLIANAILPAARAADFGSFTQSIQEYGKLSGEYYRSVQGGIYNGPVVTAVVDSLNSLGAKGIGQSSWGPVVFCWAPDEQQARILNDKVIAQWGDSVNSWITRVRNEPAEVWIEPSDC